MSTYNKFARGLYRVNQAVGKVELAMATASMIALTAVMTYQVVTRYFLGVPATWSEEFCRYLFIWASFIGSAYAVWVGDHIEIDLIDSAINARSRNPERFFFWFKKLGLIIVLIFSCYFFRTYFDYVLQIAKLRQFSGAMEINMVIPMASGVAGMALIVFHAVSLLLQPADSSRKTLPEQEEGMA